MQTLLETLARTQGRYRSRGVHHDDESRFRSRIGLEHLAGGEVGYQHAWGLPGGSFAERSGVRMNPLD